MTHRVGSRTIRRMDDENFYPHSDTCVCPDCMDDYPDAQCEEGPTCNICDALGHGYPGAGPCPLESPDPDYYASELAEGR